MNTTIISGRVSDFDLNLPKANYGLPHGLKFDKETRTISGIPRECGNFVFMMPIGEHIASLNITVVPWNSPCAWAGIPPLPPYAAWSAHMSGLKRGER